eukprot:TRINITY_DN2606_c0_g1_i6.p1 TRINITY_DN2606_c0_g1~~TRINITY_DN2606_c0_g1_i6.p1  ORF type:complete len:456 (-),score=112.66 TRINITY_DN2606_c0_g1_i6:1454-2821(-)
MFFESLFAFAMLLAVAFRIFPRYVRHYNKGITTFVSSRVAPEKRSRISYVVSETQGLRGSMEDRHSIDTDIHVGVDSFDGASIFTVLDGHGGKQAAEYAQKFLHKNIVSSLLSHARTNPQIDLCQVIEEAYSKTDSGFLEIAHKKGLHAGSTCVSAIVTNKQILVANIGDSRCILCLQPPSDQHHITERSSSRLSDNTASKQDQNSDEDQDEDQDSVASSTPLINASKHTEPNRQYRVPYVEMTQDHKPNRPDEQIRIEASGGFIAHLGCWRVQGILATSRSFGDKDLKEFVVSNPEFVEIQLGSRQSEKKASNATEHKQQALHDTLATGDLWIENISHVRSNSPSSALYSAGSPMRLLSPSAVDILGTKSSVLPNALVPAFLIIATDGLWDVVTNQEAADYVFHHRASDSFGVDRLVSLALQRGSSDNITVTVVDLRGKSDAHAQLVQEKVTQG